MKRDMTKGSPIKHIIMFTIPLLVGNLFQQFYSMVDTFIVGRFLGTSALASVGCTGALMFFLVGCAQGITAGFSIVTTQRVGAKDDEGVRKSFAVSIVLSSAVALALTIVGIFFVDDLLRILQTPETIIGGAASYLSIIMYGSAAMMLFNLLSNILRALGDSRTPLYFLAIACIINVVLDILFIGPMGMGVAGAAIATVVAQLVSGLLCIIVIIKKYPMLHLSKKHFEFTKAEINSHLRMGLPMGFQSSIIAIGAIMLQLALNNLGEISVAAFTAAQKVDGIAVLPLSSFGLAMATFTGQNYGAGKFKRVRQGVLQCVVVAGAISVFMGAIMIFFGSTLSRIFLGNEAEAVSLSAINLSINGFFYWALCFLFIIRNTLQGLGKSTGPTIAGIIELIMRSGASIYLAQKFGFVGACWAGPLAWMGALAVLSISFFSFLRQIKNSENLSQSQPLQN